MVGIAIKILALIGGIWAAFASYPYINEHVIVPLAVSAAIAVGILAGALILWVLTWLFSEVKNRPLQ